MKFYTGIPSINTFNGLYEFLAPKVKKIRYWRGPSRTSTPVRRFSAAPRKSGVVRRLTGQDELLLVLMKLRLGLLSRDLADRFGLSPSATSRIITTWLKFLTKTLVPHLLFNPPRDAVIATLPRKFRNSGYMNVRHIIDCTEVFIEKPKDLELQALTWSNYKHHQTVKFLVSIIPNGFFNFVSKAWGGRASDPHITRHSGFLDIVEIHDAVMADRGFQIQEDLMLKLAYLHIPPGRRGTEQMTPNEVRKTQIIANRRIYVEMAIRRLKCFRILKNEFPITLISNLDDIIQICAALCNLYPPLTKY